MWSQELSCDHTYTVPLLRSGLLRIETLLLNDGAVPAFAHCHNLVSKYAHISRLRSYLCCDRKAKNDNVLFSAGGRSSFSLAAEQKSAPNKKSNCG